MTNRTLCGLSGLTCLMGAVYMASLFTDTTSPEFAAAGWIGFPAVALMAAFGVMLMLAAAFGGDERE